MKTRHYILILLMLASVACGEPAQRIETIRTELDGLEAELAVEPNYIPEDINRDGVIGAEDLALLAAAWGRQEDANVPPEPPSDPNWPPVGDALMKAPHKAVVYSPLRTLTWPQDVSQLQPGDMVIFPAGTYTGTNVLGCSNLHGEPNNPIVFKADGEVVLDGVSSGILVKHSSWLVFDGFKIIHTASVASQAGVYSYDNKNIAYRNLSISGHYRGWFAMEGLSEIAFENCNVYDNRGSHGIYLGARGNPNSDITIKNCVIFHSGRHGIQHNGRITGLRIERNVIHSNSYAGISLVNGVCNSVIKQSLIFNNNRQGIIFHCYDDSPTSGILPYDQTGNTVADNIIWLGRTSWKGDAQTPKDHAAIHFSDVTAAKVATYADTVVRGNILAVQHSKAIETGGFDVTLEDNQEFVDGAEAPFANCSIEDWNSPEKFNFKEK